VKAVGPPDRRPFFPFDLKDLPAFPGSNGVGCERRCAPASSGSRSLPLRVPFSSSLRGWRWCQPRWSFSQFYPAPATGCRCQFCRPLFMVIFFRGARGSFSQRFWELPFVPHLPLRFFFSPRTGPSRRPRCLGVTSCD